MKRTIFLFLFIILCATSQAGTKEDIAELQRSLLDIQQQFWNLEEQLKGTKQVETSIKGLQNSTQELKETQAALNAKLEKILNDVRTLNEKLDETNRRVRDLSVSPVVPTTPPPAVNSSNASEPEQIDPAPAAASPAVTAAMNEQQLYQDALGQYMKGRFEQALRAFQDLLDQFPGSRISDDSQFMIGESYYGMKEYVDAVSEYDKVIKSYPDSDRVPGARLKKAFSLLLLGKKGQGVIELQTITEMYPNTKEASIAQQRLAEMGLE